jgi:hypothetical protein
MDYLDRYVLANHQTYIAAETNLAVAAGNFAAASPQVSLAASRRLPFIRAIRARWSSPLVCDCPACQRAPATASP